MTLSKKHASLRPQILTDDLGSRRFRGQGQHQRQAAEGQYLPDRPAIPYQ